MIHISVHARIYGMGIYMIMLPSSGFSVAHWNTYIDDMLSSISQTGR